MIRSQAWRRSSSLRRSSCTPPASDLWLMSGETSFITSGISMSAARATASSTVVASTVSATGIP